MRLVYLAALAALAASSGCSGGDKDTGDETGGADAATFSAVRDDVLIPSCGLVSCHAEGSPNGMVLVPGSEYEALVNVAAMAAPSETLVIPNDPDGSYLIKKIEGAPGIVGTPMPPPFGNLDPAQIQLIRDWIAAGAAND